MDVPKKETNSDVVFDGLGGHSKMDEKFVMLQRPIGFRLKRYKSQTKNASGKVKRLAPLPKNTNSLDDFITIQSSDEEC